MQKKVVVFSGTEQDQYGIPKPFHFYAIFVSQWKQDARYFVVSRLAMSSDTPGNTEGTELVEAQSEVAALAIAIEKLKATPGYGNLRMQISDIPNVFL